MTSCYHLQRCIKLCVYVWMNLWLRSTITNNSSNSRKKKKPKTNRVINVELSSSVSVKLYRGSNEIYQMLFVARMQQKCILRWSLVWMNFSCSLKINSIWLDDDGTVCVYGKRVTKCALTHNRIHATPKDEPTIPLKKNDIEEEKWTDLILTTQITHGKRIKNVCSKDITHILRLNPLCACITKAYLSHGKCRFVVVVAVSNKKAVARIWLSTNRSNLYECECECVWVFSTLCVFLSFFFFFLFVLVCYES